MALFAINTGCRDSEICGLRWDWEHKIPQLNTSVFVIPGDKTKNTDDRVIPLNRIATQCIQEERGKHPEYVFTFRNQPIAHMNNTSWQKARKRADLQHVRIHDLRHTCGRRMRAAGVPKETRAEILGHRSSKKDMTTHYSAAELQELMTAVEKICDREHETPALLVVRKRRGKT